MSDVKKIWLTADDLLGDSFRLARQVLESGFRPTHLVGIWRGGAPIGIAVQEFFDVHGVECDHIAIRTASYTGIDKQSKTVKVYALGYLIDTLNADDRLLVVIGPCSIHDPAAAQSHVNKLSVVKPPVRCSTTISGLTNHHTVKAPRMPCRTTVTSKPTAYTTLTGFSRRYAIAMAVIKTMMKPNVVAA